ncbi:LuxR C-terminal-related transcriptional regulator [Nocardioides lijunqiniae]|uniref:LuxR C-terminal-related transcriptional regulator n=1 Tax=Nocardioides lijunqiniae TaxID=2760832 RepID=UPI001877B1C3
MALGISRGLANTEIATELHLSVTTVKGHVTHVFEKLGVTNRVQVAICVHDASGV